jgi:hypothetical protein
MESMSSLLAPKAIAVVGASQRLGRGSKVTRGRKPGDIEALATLLVRLGDFAVAHAGRFRALDLNPIIVKPAGKGVVASTSPSNTTAAKGWPRTPPNRLRLREGREV